MNSHRISLFVTLLLLLAAISTTLAGCGNTSSSTGTSGSSSAPKIAPDFSIKTLTGETVSYSSLKGKPLVINFAASWCGPCELEAPVLAKMYEKYKDRANFLGIAVRDKEEDQRVFAERHGLNFPIGLDPDGKVLYSYQKAGKVNMSGIPTTFFVDKDGTIQAFFIGPISESTFDQRISTILN